MGIQNGTMNRMSEGQRMKEKKQKQLRKHQSKESQGSMSVAEKISFNPKSITRDKNLL